MPRRLGLLVELARLVDQLTGAAAAATWTNFCTFHLAASEK